MTSRIALNRRAEANAAKFSRTLSFAGRFSSREIKTAAFSIEITYSKINEFDAFGMVVGDADDYLRLEDFMHRAGVPFEIISASEDERRERISVRARFRNISQQFYPEDEQLVIKQQIGFFEVLDLRIEQKAPSADTSLCTYLLDGPSEFWISHAVRQVSFDGTVKTDFPRKNLELELPFNAEVQAAPHYLHQEAFAKLDQNLRVEGESFAITMRARHHGDFAEFEANADDLMDRLSLIVTYLSKSRIQWFSKLAAGDGRVLTHVKQISSDRYDADLDESPVYSQDIRAFIRTAVTQDYVLRADGLDLRLPIALYVSSQSGYLERQFVSKFEALEKIVAMHAARISLLADLDNKQTAAVTNAIRDVLGSEVAPARLKAVLDKVPDLCRVGFKKKFFAVVEKLGVRTDDLGGTRGIDAIYTVRNQIVHTPIHPEMSTIVRERARLEAILDRIILRTFGWQQRDATPTYRGAQDLAVTN